MTVFALIPVFNRLADTQQVVAELRAQTLRPTIVVIDDGSSDGTAEWLAEQADVVRLAGDGNLWWGGAIECGLQWCLPRAAPGDFVLFLNNDVFLKNSYVADLVQLSEANGRCAVGSVVFEIDSAAERGRRDARLTSLGPLVDSTRLRVWDAIDDDQGEPIVSLDALSGRGSLYPIELFHAHGTMIPRLLPHYFSDYEVAARFARKGTRLLVSREIGVYTFPVYGNDVSRLSLRDRLFSVRSAANIFHKAMFHFLIGTWRQRLTLPLRFAAMLVYQAARSRARAASPHP